MSAAAGHLYSQNLVKSRKTIEKKFVIGLRNIIVKKGYTLSLIEKLVYDSRMDVCCRV